MSRSQSLEQKQEDMRRRMGNGVRRLHSTGPVGVCIPSGDRPVEVLKPDMDYAEESGRQMEKDKVEYLGTPIGKLLTVYGVSRKFNIPIEVLEEVAPLMPHYSIKGYDGMYFFIPGEAKQWIGDNLIRRQEGVSIPDHSVVVVPEDAHISQIGMPPALAAIRGLREFHTDMFCGIYFLCQNEEVVYVGQSVNAVARVKTHESETCGQFNRMFFLRLPAGQLDEAERRFIRALRPRLNVTFNAPQVGSGPLVSISLEDPCIAAG